MNGDKHHKEKKQIKGKDLKKKKKGKRMCKEIKIYENIYRSRKMNQYNKLSIKKKEKKENIL